MYIIKPSIRKLTEDEVRAALDNQDEENLVAVEFGLMLRDLITECSRLKQVNGNLDELLNITPSCAIEKVALELLAKMTAAGGSPASAPASASDEEQK